MSTGARAKGICILSARDRRNTGLSYCYEYVFVRLIRMRINSNYMIGYSQVLAIWYVFYAYTPSPSEKFKSREIGR